MKAIAKATIAAFLLAGAATAAQAAEMFFYWKYETPLSLRGITLQDSVVIQDADVSPEYNSTYGLWNFQVLDADFSFAFNIEDPIGNLIHTYTFSGVAGATDFNVSFLTSEVAPLSPVAGPTVVADGSIQTVAGFGAGSDTYTMAFQTTVVPEPATWAMTIAGLGLVAGALRRRRASATS